MVALYPATCNHPVYFRESIYSSSVMRTTYTWYFVCLCINKFWFTIHYALTNISKAMCYIFHLIFSFSNSIARILSLNIYRKMIILRGFHRIECNFTLNAGGKCWMRSRKEQIKSRRSYLRYFRFEIERELFFSFIIILFNQMVNTWGTRLGTRARQIGSKTVNRFVARHFQMHWFAFFQTSFFSLKRELNVWNSAKELCYR